MTKHSSSSPSPIIAISTKPYQTLLSFLLFLSYAPRFSYAIVHLRGKTFSFPFIDAPARFAVSVNSSGICGALYVADPIDGCSPLQNSFGSKEEKKQVRFVLIERGECTFEEKVRNAQDSGFQAAIVFDDRDKRNLVSMIGSSEGIWAHAVFVSKAAGETLRKFAQGEKSECCISPSLEEAAWTVLVISFISLLVIVCVLGTFFFTRNRRVHRQGSHHYSPSIDKQIVEVLPCFTFNTTTYPRDRHAGETCAICLEDYRDGEILRRLPCHHDFHAKCVDSWLTKWGTFCPVCKHEMSTSLGSHLVSERTSLLS